MLQGLNGWRGWLLLAAAMLVGGSTNLAAQPDGSGGQDKSDLLLLVTERFERPDDGGSRLPLGLVAVGAVVLVGSAIVWRRRRRTG